MKINIKYQSAPKWFLKIVSETDKLEQQCADMIGVGTNWFEVDKRKGHSVDQIIEDFKLSKEDGLRFRFSIKKRNILSELMWIDFRLKNVTNEWGLAEHLNYNSKREIIIMKEPLSSYIKKGLEEITKKYFK